MRNHPDPYWLYLEPDDIVKPGDMVSAAGNRHYFSPDSGNGGWMGIEKHWSGHRADNTCSLVFARRDSRSLEILSPRLHSTCVAQLDWEMSAVNRHGSKTWIPLSKSVNLKVLVGTLDWLNKGGTIRRKIPNYTRHDCLNPNVCPICPKVPKK